MEDQEDDENLLLLCGSSRAFKPSLANNLIIKINSLLKKPVIEDDLSECLQSYSKHLQTSEVYLENGVLTTNFAEGALLLQSASQLYSKKVDLLWDFIIAHVERNLQYEEKTEENAEDLKMIQEKKERFKRKRKKIEQIQEIETEITNEEEEEEERSIRDFTDEEIIEISELEHDSLELESNQCDPYFLAAWYIDNICGKTKSDLTSPLLLELSKVDKVKGFAELEKLPLYRSIDYDVNEINEDGEKEFLYNVSESIFHRQEDTDIRKIIKNLRHLPEAMPYDIMEFIIDEFLVTHNAPVESLYHEFDKVLDYYVTTVKKQGEEEPTNRLDAMCKAMCPRRPSVLLERLSPEVVNKYLHESISEEEVIKEMVPVRKNLDSRSDVDSGFFSHHDDLDCSYNQSEGDKLRPSSTPFQAFSPFSEESERDVMNESGFTEGTLSTPQTPRKHVDSTVEKCQRRKRKLDDEVSLTEAPKKPRKPRFKLRSIITVSLRNFELYYYYNYKTEEGEGEIVHPGYEEDDEEEEDDCHEEDPSIPVAETPEPTNLITLETSTPKSITNLFPSHAEQVMKYLEWEGRIKEKLRLQKLEQPFDIHVEGMDLMNRIGEVNETIKFKKLITGKSTAKSFAAILQLANTSNVEIINPTPGCVANDSLDIKLLTKQQYYEQLSEFAAPSELTFQKRLQNARSDVSKRHVANSDDSNSKRQKLR